jgi:hypothetical protein
VALDLVLIGLAIALGPLPLTAFLIVLPSKRGVRKGAAFVFGWLVSLGIVVTVTVVATGNNPPKPNTAPSLADLAVKIAIGVILVAIAVRQRRRLGQPKKPKKPPKWQVARGQHVPVVRHGPCARAPAMGSDQRGRCHCRRSQTVQYRELPRVVPVLRPSLGVLPRHGDPRRFQARPEPGVPGQAQDLDKHHTDQVIIWGSLILGLWLIAYSIYLIP